MRKKLDALYLFLRHLNSINSEDRNYEAYEQGNGIRITMDYTPSGVYDVVTALADNYRKDINFTATVQITVGPDSPPAIQISILPRGSSWVYRVIREGVVLCDLDTLVGYYDGHVNPHPDRQEVLDRIK